MNSEATVIEGLKVTVVGNELKSLCLARANYHTSRAKHYREQQTALPDADDGAGQHSSKQSLEETIRSRIAHHEGEAAELQFIAGHLMDAAQYRLDRSALVKLGISTAAF